MVTPILQVIALEGKARGTQMIYEAFCKTFDYSAIKKLLKVSCPSVSSIFTGADFKEQYNSVI